MSTEVVESVLDDLLSRDAIEDRKHYIVSATRAFRQLGASSSAMLANHTGGAEHDYLMELPEYVGAQDLLGTFEQSLLSNILTSRASLLIFRGAAGTGKSSTFLHLAEHCNEYIDEPEAASPFGFPLSCLRVSCMDVAGEMTGMDAIDASAADLAEADADHVRQAVSDVLSSISETLMSELRTRCERFGRLILRALERATDLKTTLRASPDYSALQKIDRDLKNRERTKRHDEIDREKAAEELIDEFLNSSPSAKESFRLVMQLCATLAEGRGEHNRPFLVILDDVDALPATVQLELLPLVTPSSSHWRGGLRVVMPMRLSTFRNGVNVKYAVEYQFIGPEPSAVLFQRITRFLTDPKRYWRGTDAQKRATYSRLAELWLCLASRDGWVRETLDAAAGTNIRNAFDLAQNWAMNSHYVRSVDVKHEEFKRDLEGMLTPLFVDECIETCSRALLRFLSSVSAAHKDQRINDSWCDKFLARLISDLGDSLSEFFADLPLLYPGFDPANAAAIAFACEAGRIRDGLRYAYLERQAPRHLRELRAGRLRTMLSAAMERRSDVEGDAGGAEATRVLRSAVGAMRELLGDAGLDAPAPPEEEQRGKFPSALAAAIAEGGHDREIGKFRAARALLADRHKPRELFGERVVNVYTIDGVTVSAVRLRVLSLINDAKAGGLEGQRLLDDAAVTGIKPKTLARAMKDLMGVDRRLVWCTRKDIIASADDLKDRADQRFVLSAAGNSYLNRLVRSPAYLQLSLDEIGQVSSAQSDRSIEMGESGSGVLARIDRVLIGFQLMFEDEFGRLELLHQNVNGLQSMIIANSPRRGLACMDGFVGALQAYIHPLLAVRTILKGKRHKRGVEVAESLLNEFIALARSNIERARQVFGGIDMRRSSSPLARALIDWQEVVEPLARTVELRLVSDSRGRRR